MVELEKPGLGGEDFSFFARERPALMAWLSCRPSKTPPEAMAVLHNITVLDRVVNEEVDELAKLPLAHSQVNSRVHTTRSSVPTIMPIS